MDEPGDSSIEVGIYCTIPTIRDVLKQSVRVTLDLYNCLGDSSDAPGSELRIALREWYVMQPAVRLLVIIFEDRCFGVSKDAVPVEADQEAADQEAAVGELSHENRRLLTWLLDRLNACSASIGRLSHTVNSLRLNQHPFDPDSFGADLDSVFEQMDLTFDRMAMVRDRIVANVSRDVPQEL